MEIYCRGCGIPQPKQELKLYVMDKFPGGGEWFRGGKERRICMGVAFIAKQTLGGWVSAQPDPKKNPGLSILTLYVRIILV